MSLASIEKDGSDGGKEFYFLGCMLPTQHYGQFVMANTDKTAVEITYRLDTRCARTSTTT